MCCIFQICTKICWQCVKNKYTVSEKKELSSTLTGFKTAVQKAAFKHDQVFFLHTSNFTSVTSVCCISLSPSFYSLPTPPHLRFALMFFICKFHNSLCTMPIQDLLTIRVLFMQVKLKNYFLSYGLPSTTRPTVMISITSSCSMNWGFKNCWCQEGSQWAVADQGLRLHCQGPVPGMIIFGM